jgi:hypothetical protein
MNRKILLLAVVLIVISSGKLFAQFSQPDGSPIAGFEFRPIIPSNLFRTGPINSSIGGTNFTISQQFGYVFGMVIDGRIYKNFEIESGISFTQRNYNLTISDGSFTGTSSFRIIGYEIPLSAIVSIPLTEKFRMNNALGFALDAFPSNIATTGDYYTQEGLRLHTIVPAFIANTGVKYTTDQLGAVYIGASYHLPFSNIYENSAQYQPNDYGPTLLTYLRGNYFTADFKYFFPYHKTPPRYKKKNKYGGTNNN